MKILFLKIFALFWFAQGLIAIASTVLILSHRAPDGGASVRSLREGLNIEAKEAVRIYQEGGCQAVRHLGDAHQQSMYLLTSQSVDICSGVKETEASGGTPIGQDIYGRSEGERYLWRVPVGNPINKIVSVQIAVVRSSRGASFVHDLRDYGFPQLPIILGVGGVMTFLLVLLMTRPLSLLSASAKAMADGDLSVRVPQTPGSFRHGEDAFQELIRDFNRMAERLQGLVEAHKLLLRDVSHELRSPLTRLNVALGLAKERIVGMNSPYLDRVEQEADRVNSMINQLLTLSSMEISNPTTQQLICLRKLIEVPLADARFEASLTDCTVTLLQQGDYWLRGHGELLARALENVIRNAVRYTRHSSEVTVTVSNDPGGSGVVIEIADDGPGIPEKDLHSIFQPFFRTEEARAYSSEGFGVGLAIAKRAVELHRGIIFASNRRGGGALITITLPIETIDVS